MGTTLMLGNRRPGGFFKRARSHRHPAAITGRAAAIWKQLGATMPHAVVQR